MNWFDRLNCEKELTLLDFWVFDFVSAAPIRRLGDLPIVFPRPLDPKAWA
jgi:hypothetical protein